MPEKDIGKVLAKAREFFERAQVAEEKGDFNSAIGLYLEGLRYAPDAVQEGHIKLRELALRREAQDGSKPSAEEVKEQLGRNTALEQMLGAEYLLAKAPGHLPYAEAILKAAVAGGYRETAKWIADLMFLANNNAKKPSLQVYLLLKDSYEAIGQLGRAVAACRSAVRLKPKDGNLVEEFKNLSAKLIGTGDIGGQKDLVKSRKQHLSEQKAVEVEQGDDMPEEDSAQLLNKAEAFFKRAREAAEMNSFDYAIDMYLEGLRCTPDALRDGHIALCELALHRQEKGGKKPTMMERVKFMRGAKTNLEQMLNAEYLFAKDPSHLPYAEAMLKAAIAGGYRKTAAWIANYVFQENNVSKKPSLHTYLLLKNTYESLGDFNRAAAACQRAMKLKPEDHEIADDFKRLSAEITVASGKYDQEGDFRHSIKDRKKQEKLQAQESFIKTDSFRRSAVEEARDALAQDPGLSRNIFNLAEALSDLETDEADNEAVELLEDTYEAKMDFSYKERAGEIRIKQLRRKLRQAEKALRGDPGDTQKDSEVARLLAQLQKMELEHYRLCVENYPTDLRAKYEYGVRLVRDKKYDDAIPLFQDAQRDPRHKISAMNRVGLCFFMKGWFDDAIDIFTRAIESHEIKDDGIAKELRYNLARSYQEHGDDEKAMELYRKIAQLDFAYKDIRQQIDKLRGSSNSS